MERRGRLDWNGGNIGCIAGLSREGVTKQEGSWSDLRTLAYAARPDRAGSVSSDLFDISKDQARLLFEQSDDEDLVSNKQLIRLRFANGLGGKLRPVN